LRRHPVPFLLLLLYQHVPLAREMRQMEQDKNVHITLLGGVSYRLRGEALCFTAAYSTSGKRSVLSRLDAIHQF